MLLLCPLSCPCPSLFPSPRFFFFDDNNNNKKQPSTPTLVQHGFTVAAAAAAATTDTSSPSSSDGDNINIGPFAPSGAETTATSSSTTPPPPPSLSLGALGAALASADAEAEGDDDDDDDETDSEAYDAFSSDERGGDRGGKKKEPPSSSTDASTFVVDVVGTRHRTPAVRALARAVVRGLRSGARPPSGPSPEGLGGSYVFSDERGRPAAIVKPCDEEPLAPNNPKGFVGRGLGDPGLRPTVRVGQAALREVAAYLLDHGGLARVPPTVLVRVAHPVFHVAAAAEGKGKGAAAAASGEALPTTTMATTATTTTNGLPHVPSSSSSSFSPLATAATAPPSLLSLSLGPQKPREQGRFRDDGDDNNNSNNNSDNSIKGRKSSSSRRCPASSSSSASRGKQHAHLPAPKLASLQQYVRHDGDAADAGASRFSVRDVHAIGILDIRLLNSDRHAGNLLVRRRSEREVQEEEEEEGERERAAGVGAAAAAAAASAAPLSSSQKDGQRRPLQKQQQHPSTSLLARFDAAAARAARDGRSPLELVPIDHGEKGVLEFFPPPFFPCRLGFFSLISSTEKKLT